MNDLHQIEIKEAKKFLKIHYNIDGQISSLPGEIEQNFKVDTKTDCYVLKINNNFSDNNFFDFQDKLLTHLSGFNAPIHIKSVEGNPYVFLNSNGRRLCLRVLNWISGRIWQNVNPKTDELRYKLGVCCGSITQKLLSFNHSFSNRKFEWDLAQSNWVKKHTNKFNDEKKVIINSFLDHFKKNYEEYKNLKKSVVHNDANDYNIIVNYDYLNPKVISLIDYGDAIYTQIINDLAITCTYAIMNVEDPLDAAIPIIKGYNLSNPLDKNDLKYLYNLIGIRLIISVTKSMICRNEMSFNDYLWISEKSAWGLLKKWAAVNSEFAHYRFREACGFEPHPNKMKFLKWNKNNKTSLLTLFPSISKIKVQNLNLSFESTWLGRKEEFDDLDIFQHKIGLIQKKYADKIIAGGYLESRPIYTSSEYDRISNEGTEKRCLHLGLDFWVPSKTPIHLPFDGEIKIISNDIGEKAFGPMVIVKHKNKNFSFYTLYGHLSVKSLTKIRVGDKLKKGDFLGWIGDSHENGNWVPHLHFQILLSLLDMGENFPGVGYQKHIKSWKSICPDPDFIFLEDISTTDSNYTQKKIITDRENTLGKGLSLQYKNPLHIVRGEGIFLIDNNGRNYIDMINNVAHVGHEHPDVVKAGQLQMGQLNTNSRYLHPNITRLAKRLIATFPSDLSIVHFVNSGSEANELALRMIKTVTGSDEILVSKYGYHGNTKSCINISSYKFDGKGGEGKPNSTNVFPIPDPYRGVYRGENTANSYVKEIEAQIKMLKKKNKKLGGLIIEPIISCGGQVELPKGFLSKAFDLVKKEKGICVVDEVQTGCGRVGSHFWGFQLHNVIPDIVTIGKPLGNGHPVAAVVCTNEVANKFNNGMEFFNTFGGNPVSCAIANKVLEIVQNEKLQQNAFKVGNFLKKGIKKLVENSTNYFNVRGQGLFLGIEFVDENLLPKADKANYVVDRMKFFGILLSTDGPDKNVIKIKPPLIFSIDNAKFFLKLFSNIINEDFMLK